MKTLKELGFTLVELLIVLLIIAVVIVIAAPNFSNVTQKNKIVAATNELTGLFQYAKSTALVNNMPVIVCPATAGVTSSYECVKDDDGFANADRVVVFQYVPGDTGATKEMVRVIYLPSSITLKKIKGKTSIAFFPDNSAGIHGIGTNFNYFQTDGSYKSKSIVLGDLDFPKAGTVSWLVTSKAKSDAKCNLINVSSLGQSNVEVKEGSDCQ